MKYSKTLHFQYSEKHLDVKDIFWYQSRNPLFYLNVTQGDLETAPLVMFPLGTMNSAWCLQRRKGWGNDGLPLVGVGFNSVIIIITGHAPTS